MADGDIRTMLDELTPSDRRPAPEGGTGNREAPVVTMLDRPESAGPEAPRRREYREPDVWQRMAFPVVAGVGDVAGLPGFAAEMAGAGLSRLLGRKHPLQSFGEAIGPEAVMGPARRFGIIPEDPGYVNPDVAGRYLDETTRFITGGMGLGRLAQANRLPRRGPPGVPASWGEPAPETVRGRVAQAAGRTLGETSPMTAGAIGSQVVRETVPEMQAGPLAGAALGAAGVPVVRNLVAGARNAGAGLSRLAAERGARARVAEQLASRLGETPAEAYLRVAEPDISLPQPPNPYGGLYGPEGLAEARKGLVPAIEGYSPGVGTLTGDPTLLGLERALGRTAIDSATLNEMALRGVPFPAEVSEANRRAVRSALTEPPIDTTPGLVRTVADEFRDRALSAAERRAAELEAQAGTDIGLARGMEEAAQARLPPAAGAPSRQAAAGQTLREELVAAQQQWKKEASDLFDKVDPDQQARIMPYAFRDARDAVIKMANDRNRQDAIPKIMRKPTDQEGRPYGNFIDDLLQGWQDGGGTRRFLPAMTYEQAKGLRTRLTDALREEDKPQAREFINMLIKGVDDSIGRSMKPEQVEAYIKARDFFRKNVAENFYDQGPGRRALEGEFAGTTGAQFFRPGPAGGESMESFTRIMGGREKARDALRSYAVDDIVSYATNREGRIDPGRMREWLDKHSPALDKWPDLKRELENRATVQSYARQHLEDAMKQGKEFSALAQQTVKRTQDALDKSAARFFLDNDPEVAVRSIIGAPDRAVAAQKAMQFLRRSPDAQRGLARAYWDYISKRVLSASGEGYLSADRFHKIMRDEADVIAAIMPKDVQERLATVGDAITMEGRIGRQRAPGGGSNTPEDIGINRSLLQDVVGGYFREGNAPVWMATAGAAIAGPVGAGTGAWLGRILQAKGGRDAAVREAILREAMFDHNVFREMMRTYKGVPRIPYTETNVVAPFILGTVLQAGQEQKQSRRAAEGEGNYAEGGRVFDPEGEGYDYETAEKSGLGPDEEGHWPSRDPRTGQMLKGRKHPTWGRAEAADAAMGYETTKRGDRYYSEKVRGQDYAEGGEVDDGDPGLLARWAAGVL